MLLKVLIDGVVQQTMVLIAQIATTAGVRAPLTNLADEVFRHLASELEAQGVRRRVAADMFGLALRSYQKKMQRVAQSSAEQNKTLWEAVIDALRTGSLTRRELVARFRADDERELGAVMADLVASGLVYSTGSGHDCVYGLSTDQDRRAVLAGGDEAALANVLWFYIFCGDIQSDAEILTALGVDAVRANGALERLLADGRVARAGNQLLARNLVVPVGASEGWETAVLDHFRAVTSAIVSKLRRGVGTETDDTVGGGTLSFRVYPGHPYEAEVKGLLRRVRANVDEIWQHVASYNEAHTPPEHATRVQFYFGQNVLD